MEPCHFEPNASNSDEDGDMEVLGKMKTLVACSLQICRFCFSV